MLYWEYDMESMADGCLDIEEMAVNRLHLIIRGQTMSCRIDVMKKATHNLKKKNHLLQFR